MLRGNHCVAYSGGLTTLVLVIKLMVIGGIALQDSARQVQWSLSRMFLIIKDRMRPNNAEMGWSQLLPKDIRMFAYEWDRRNRAKVSKPSALRPL